MYVCSMNGERQGKSTETLIEIIGLYHFSFLFFTFPSLISLFLFRLLFPFSLWFYLSVGFQLSAYVCRSDNGDGTFVMGES